MSFFQELKRRNVVRVGIAYVLMGWVLLQAADFGLDLIDAPNWVIQAFAMLVALGLPIALFLAWAFELTPEGIKRESEIDRSQSITTKTGRKLDFAIIGVLAVIIIGMGVERLYFAEKGSEKGSEPFSETSAQQASASGEKGSDPISNPISKSIAVLPFADLSQAKDQEWFADGLAEEILNALVKVPDLSVASRTSSFQFRDTTKSIAEIASELGVAHVLEGSIRSGGERIRVTAQLIRASDGFHLWSETYDRDTADMITIQEDLARNIASVLETSMDPQALAEMAQVGTRSVEAYQAYLRGVQLSNEAFSNSGGGTKYREAYELFEAALAIDPGFAEAQLKAADYWKVELLPTRMDTGSSGLSTQEVLNEFYRRIQLAIDSARNDGDRIRSLANRAVVDLRLNEARRLYEQYLQLRPNDETARLELVSILQMMSEHEAASTELLLWRAKGETDEYSAGLFINSAYRSMDPSEAADFGLEALKRWPTSSTLAYQTHRTLLWAGRNAEASEVATRYRVLVPGGSPLVDAREACAAGDREAAENILATVAASEVGNRISLLWLINNMLGNHEAEVKALRPLEESGVPFQLADFLGYPKFDPRPFPSIMAILEREGINRPEPLIPPFSCPPAPDQLALGQPVAE
jgi:TolB-like protein/tetratricopeptide (TPR) repeat protein